MMNDPLANALNTLLNAEKVGKNTIVVKPINTMIKAVFSILNEEGYVGNAEEEEDGGGKKATINLIGKINKAGAIKPRFAMKFEDVEKYEKRYLPARGFGILILSTSTGLITNEEARKQKIGGRLIAYCY